VGAKFCRRCGADLADPPPEQANTDVPESQNPAVDSAPSSPLMRRLLRRRLLLAGALVLVVFVALGVVSGIQRTFYPPDGPVRDLFAALDVATGKVWVRVWPASVWWSLVRGVAGRGSGWPGR
jgi:hypothetical protein